MTTERDYASKDWLRPQLIFSERQLRDRDLLCWIQGVCLGAGLVVVVNLIFGRLA